MVRPAEDDLRKTGDPEDHPHLDKQFGVKTLFVVSDSENMLPRFLVMVVS